MSEALAGVFVGGAGSRMGGVAKGLLRTSDGMTIIQRWRTLLGELGVRVVLVGSAQGYTHLGIPIVGDEPHGIGPLGGLAALLRHAGEAPALALACDMPFVTGRLVRRLLSASPEAPIVAPRRDGLWEPLCARYDSPNVLPTVIAMARAGDHSLQGLLRLAGAIELPMVHPDTDELRDWDTPEQVVDTLRSGR
jgi:molybdopterin-guanine dinucleotide biosynthesis protein A